MDEKKLYLARITGSYKQRGINLYGSNNPWVDGGYYVPFDLPNVPESELEKDRFYFREGIHYIRSNPKRFLILTWKRQVRLWSANRNWALDATDFILFR